MWKGEAGAVHAFPVRHSPSIGVGKWQVLCCCLVFCLHLGKGGGEGRVTPPFPPAASYPLGCKSAMVALLPSLGPPYKRKGAGVLSAPFCLCSSPLQYKDAIAARFSVFLLAP